MPKAEDEKSPKGSGDAPAASKSAAPSSSSSSPASVVPPSSSAPPPPEKPFQVWDSKSNSWVARKATSRDDEFNSRRTKWLLIVNFCFLCLAAFYYRRHFGPEGSMTAKARAAARPEGGRTNLNNKPMISEESARNIREWQKLKAEGVDPLGGATGSRKKEEKIEF